MPTISSKKLSNADIVRLEYYARGDDEVISPAHLASSAYNRIDQIHAAPGRVRWAAIMELRQLARGVCRSASLLIDAAATYGTPFWRILQHRYPAKRGGRYVYVPRMQLTTEERYAIYSRLRKESDAKGVHACALEAETEMLIRAGRLSASKEQEGE